MQSTGKRSFRDTLWFKKGAADDEARRAATGATGEALAIATATDLLPVEDRYLDDGSLTSEDSVQFSVRTGKTQAVPRITTPPAEPRSPERLDALVRELSWSRARLAVIGACVAGVALIVAVFVL